MNNIDDIRRSRIRISMWAYAYEIKNNPIVSDDEYDKAAYSLDITTPTGYELLDNFFKNEFIPDTGMWIYNHPELYKIADIYNKLLEN